MTQKWSINEIECRKQNFDGKADKQFTGNGIA
jgi:hypothetical protein